MNLEIANIIANAMKDWALEHGCTHFTHWFQPMTGITAEKHESFISPTAEGRVIMDFSGKELIQGEPDALQRQYTQIVGQGNPCALQPRRIRRLRSKRFEYGR